VPRGNADAVANVVPAVRAPWESLLSRGSEWPTNRALFARDSVRLTHRFLFSSSEVSVAMFAHHTALQRSRQRSILILTPRTLALAATSAILAGAWCSGAIGQGTFARPDRTTMMPLNPARPTTYRDVLVFGLKARLPSELAYVNSVVAAVEDGKLPSRLVDQTFFWARTHAGTSLYGQPNRPIIYFIPALNARLQRLHLNVDLVGGLP
jgi:hypothetical protein